MKALARVAVALVALGLTAAKGDDPPPRFPLKAPVAVAPFENLSGNRDATAVLTWMLDGAMRENRVRVAGELSPGLFSGRLATPLELQQAAAGLGAEWTLTGTILEYGYREAAIPGDPMEPIVSLDLRLVSVTSGAIVWQQTFSASSHGAERRRSLAAVARGIAAKVGTTLAPEDETPDETAAGAAAGSPTPKAEAKPLETTKAGQGEKTTSEPKPAATAGGG